MDESTKHFLKVGGWLIGLAIIFIIFISFNSSMRVMNSSCDGPQQGRAVSSCDPVERPMTPILD